jgi:hypothetical protein
MQLCSAAAIQKAEILKLKYKKFVALAGWTSCA